MVFQYKNFVLCAVAVYMLSGCSSPEPPQSFLRANIRIVDTTKEGGGTELLRMKPADLNAAFDRNVTKKWKKEHENSWSLIINGRDPETKIKNKLVFTLSTNTQLNGDFIITKLVVNGNEYGYQMIADMMRVLDEAYLSPPK